jgi:YidC/Oxa1 family membrane protein insertase
LNIFLTKSTMPVIGWIADILGYVISGIYWCLEKIGLPNIGLAIILYTFVMYLLMTPLQIKQQKFSKMNSIMMPEIRKIQDKYKNKKDQNSMAKMQEETQAIYQKYGVSPTGSCVQMFIILPVMLALYQVIYHIPGYISSVREIFTGLVDKISAIPNFTDILQNFIDSNNITTTALAVENGIATSNSVIDMLYNLTTNQWHALANVADFSGISNAIESTQRSITNINMFCGLNISDTPFVLIKDGFSNHNYLIIIGAILIPVLAWFTQWLNYKLMPQAMSTGNGEEASAMESSMKSMNTVMPLMSAFFCVTFPVGIGIYWIAGAVFRCFQQLIINRHLEKMDIDELIRKNQEKAKKKREKEGLPPNKITQQATQNARRINERGKGVADEEKEKAIKRATEYYNSGNLKAGSIASKANMVRQFEEKNKKK